MSLPVSKGDFYVYFCGFRSEIGELEGFGCIFMRMASHFSVWDGQKNTNVQLNIIHQKLNFPEHSHQSIYTLASGASVVAFHAFRWVLPHTHTQKHLTNPILSVSDTPDKAKLTNSAAIPPSKPKFSHLTANINGNPTNSLVSNEISAGLYECERGRSV